MSDLRYPLGHFIPPQPLHVEQVRRSIDDIAELPAALRAVIEPLSVERLDTPYRPGGWTVRQVVHHLADSHLNGVSRHKWALTETRPTIKTYHEELWAELADYLEYPVPEALDFLERLHQRWVMLLRSLTPDQLERDFVHPDTGLVTLAENIGLYAWHGRHHLAHITALIERRGWHDADDPAHG